MTPKISVIIPVYNVEKYLNECLDSVCAQTLKDIEIICINDGSTDRSLEILESYAKKDKRIKILNKKNSGYGDSMNQGLDMAIGDYVGIVESDDYISLKMFEILYSLAMEEKEDIIKSNFYIFTNNVNNKYQINKIYKFTKLQNLQSYTNKEIPEFITNGHPCIWSAIYNNKFLKKYNIKFSTTPGAAFQDVGFNIKSWIFAQKIKIIEEAFYYYRKDNENSSINLGKKMAYVTIREYSLLYDFLANKHINKDLQMYIDKKCVQDLLYNYETRCKKVYFDFLHLSKKIFDRFCTESFDTKNYDLFYKSIKNNLFSFYLKKLFFHKIKLNNNTKISYIFNIPIRKKIVTQTHNIYKICGIKIKFKRKEKINTIKKNIVISNKNNLTTPKISVIVPIYNVEPYLKKCLDSIVNQTYKDIEIICVNDGSTDNSLQIIKEYAKADFRIKIIDKENGGLSSARNEGLKIANGEWISFVDSDDWLDIYAYEKLEKYFHHDPDIICFGTHIRGDVSDKLLQTDNEYYKIRYEDLVDLTDEIRLLTNVGAWNKLWKKSIIDTYELTFPVGMHYEDYSFYWNYIFESKNAYYVKEKFYNYLRRSNSIMANTFNKTSTKIIDHLYASEFIYDHLKKRNLLFIQSKTFINIFIYCFWFVYIRSNIKHKKDVLFKATELLKKFDLGEDFNNQNDVIKHIANAKYYKIPGVDYSRPFLQKLFSVRNHGDDKIIIIFGLTIKIKNSSKHLSLKIKNLETKYEVLKKEIAHAKQMNFLGKKISMTEFFHKLYLDMYSHNNPGAKIDPNQIFGIGMCTTNRWINLKYIFPNLKILPFQDNDKNLDVYLLWGTPSFYSHYHLMQKALFYNKPAYIVEDGFLKSLNTWVDESLPSKQVQGISFTIDYIPYYDARFSSGLEQMLNDKNLIITDEQRQRARKCIDKIVSTHLTKYNHQPIFQPRIGRDGVKKVLVVDQSYGDMSIIKGLASDDTFVEMLNDAIKDNPNADIIVKTHPDTIAGRKGFYAGLKASNNIYTQTDPINPISLIKYVDKVYVCTSQLGFEALMCDKETHVYGMPFYAGWGLTIDYQNCERRTNKRTLEELFYIAYIIYSHYVNPDKQCRCEIEEAMDYLLKLREEYFDGKK